MATDTSLAVDLDVLTVASPRLRTVGVEEELLLVDHATGAPVAAGSSVLAAGTALPVGALQSELQEQQVETATTPTRTIGDLGEQLVSLRRVADVAARTAGARVAALATSPLPVRPVLSDGARFRAIEAQMGLTCQEQLTCGCHVHVAIDSADEGVAVLDRIRPWLPLITALAANSPFWGGRDTSYASYRTQAWSRWPGTGPTDIFGSAAAYQDVVARMLATQTLLDGGMVYFDARLSHRHPTVEIRVADVCLDVRDTMLVASLCRALVQTAADQWRTGVPPSTQPTVVVRLAAWRASRFGLSGDLVHPVEDRLVPARDALSALLHHVSGALEAAGELAWAREEMSALLARGTGADRQRAQLSRGGDLSTVVARAVDATLADRRA
ncbi:glutamate--cysteine ligase [Cellulomonas sp. URHE0023]|uniref:glutamate--cysteine ligase n=1 Tax=Cellulomonas sp. URHE0023 TaxID=1380354 RepID=UPI000A95F509|nr:glutamate--cysteine ligase [Cellulomonas sp. URHE0023]